MTILQQIKGLISLIFQNAWRRYALHSVGVGIFLLFSSVLAFAITPLAVDKAFQVSAHALNSSQISVQWQIAPGYHLYRQRMHIQTAAGSAAQLGAFQLPAGIPVHDNILGNYQIYRHQVAVTVPVIQAPRRLHLQVSYQGCSEAGFCYPPVTKNLSIDMNQTTLAKAMPITLGAMNMQTQVENLLSQRNYFWICLVFIGLGILLSFTPCVLPMIPILSGIIVGQNRRELTTRRAFFVSLSYVLGMSLAYALAGILVAVAGSHLTAALQTPWVIVLFSALFILLALSLFGLYELRLPHFLHHHVVNLSNRQKSGTFIGAFFMGALAVLIVSPCVTAPLVGILTFIAQTGDVILGAVALFALGIGMGLPLLVIGTTEGKFLPKSGPWMQVIKATFGVLLIAVALYLLQRILPGYASLFLWAAFLIMLAAYLGVGTHPHNLSSGWIKFGKGLGLFSFCYGVVLLVGGALGHSDPLQPLKGVMVNTLVPALASGTSMQQQNMSIGMALPFQRITSLAELQTLLKQAQQRHQLVMLDFYADWCVACHEMARTTFADPQVQAALKDMLLIQADVTANDKNNQALEAAFQVIAPPTILFFNPKGQEISQARIIGAVPAAGFLQHLQAVKSASL